jgi:hypothetical protein
MVLMTDPFNVTLMPSCCGGDCCSSCAGTIESGDEFVRILFRGGDREYDLMHHLDCWRHFIDGVTASPVPATSGPAWTGRSPSAPATPATPRDPHPTQQET